MDNLDQPQTFAEFDRENMLRHIMELPDQVEQCWKEMQSFIVPTPYIRVKNVVVLGMGGSGIGGLLGQYLAKSTSKVPINVVQDYVLPEYVSTDSLVIAVSYSGGTEETLTAFQEAGKRQAKLIVVTMGGELASISSRFRAPVYQINYGSPPRAALGYTYLPLLAIFNKLGFIELERDEIKETIVLMRGLRAKLAADVPSYQNDAKKMAFRMQNMLPMIIGSGTLYPVAYRWAGMINENAKHFATALALPEICHNWISGTKFPAEWGKQILAVILQSKHDHPRNRLRQNVISQILRKAGVEHEFVFIHPSGTMLSEQLMTLYFGDFVSYYLAMLHDVNPTTIEEVVYLKRQLESNKE